ncbi:feline leukemia virus subgroup C receptor-related protein 1-like isoform X2 [Zootermopsis nevadensis]|uniref:Feline leukemia virus subgroup C receptor-related protein 1 n=1 Tax=Zootermopsis nevadensis TaxID=136037 RepID=A0A067RHQ0_ZOONE|nr:feline leukemia virus subgroup C receptor-related protein 1-like isoform X2 [Zootermopsis nevadensis]KDR23327.1 Feline leukemia virus subgroup C receptor-related protein 1 [Zootermopsis nevadensis]
MESCETSSKTDYTAYSKRWLILLIYFYFAVMSAFQWYQYSSITNIIVRYYSVDNFYVNCTTLMFNVTFIALVFPASYLLNKVGMRWSVILGTFFTAAGALVKVASVKPGLFWVTFLGQTLVSFTQAVAMPMPPFMPAVWFPSNQVNTACSIAVNGTMLGIALGFVVPPIMVQNHDNLEEVGAGLATMFYWTAGLSTGSFILAILFLESMPATPPSHEQALKDSACAPLVKILKNLFLNPCYVLLLIAYAINQGVVNSMSTFLNQMILPYFKNGEEFAGRIGLTLTVAGMMGTTLCGIIMDRTLKYMFFLGGYVPIAYSFSYEVTYPEPEGTSSGMLSAAAQIVTTIFTLLYAAMISSLGNVWANIAFSLILLIGTIIHLFMQPTLRRQAAYENVVSINEPLLR